MLQKQLCVEELPCIAAADALSATRSAQARDNTAFLVRSIQQKAI